MTPAGPERDREIAEIRGECGKKPTKKCPCCMGKATGHGCTCREPSIAPYSTDIACAMELWEEMKGEWEEIELAYTFDMPESRISCFLCNAGALRVAYTIPDFNPDTQKYNPEADAISGAYLKWRKQ